MIEIDPEKEDEIRRDEEGLFFKEFSFPEGAAIFTLMVPSLDVLISLLHEAQNRRIPFMAGTADIGWQFKTVEGGYNKDWAKDIIRDHGESTVRTKE